MSQNKPTPDDDWLGKQITSRQLNQGEDIIDCALLDMYQLGIQLMQPDEPRSKLRFNNKNLAKAAINAKITELLVEELDWLTLQGDIAWVKRGDVDSHEQFVHTNIILDRIAQLQASQPINELEKKL